MVFSDPVSALPQINSGTLQALPCPARSARRCFRPCRPRPRAAIPDLEAVAWHGIFVPARTPQPIIEQLNLELVKALQIHEIKDLLSKQAMSPVGV